MSLVPIQQKEAPGSKKSRAYLKSFSELYDRAAGSGLVPPQCLEIEQSVLGAMMIDQSAAGRILDTIGLRTFEDSPFYRQAHTAIYRAAMNLSAKGSPIDLRTMHAQLKLEGDLEEIGGPAYLVELSEKVVTTANVEAHSRLILEKYLARELIRVCEEAKLRAFVGEDDTFELLDMISAHLFKLSEVRHAGGSVIQKIGSMIGKAVDYITSLADPEKRKLIFNEIGLSTLDTALGGFARKNLVMIAGRPGSGKSALASAIVRRFKKPSAYISIEMGDTEIAIRLCCQQRGVSVWHATNGKLDDRGKDRFTQGAMEIAKLPILLLDQADITATQIRRLVREWVKREGIELVIVDHVGIVAPESGKGNDTRYDQVGFVTRTLKKVAKECNITVLALHQLNRKVEERPDKRPKISDLRDSGNVEEDCDIIMLLFRPAYYEMAEEFPGQTEVNIAKFRNGAPQRVNLTFRSFSTDFEDGPEYNPKFGRLAQQELDVWDKPKDADTVF